MRAFYVLKLGVVLLCLASCSTKKISVSELTGAEQGLLRAINEERLSHGKKALSPALGLTKIARKDAKRRVLTGEGYVDHREETGYERMLTLAGRATSGPEFGKKLMRIWLQNPIQRTWLEDDYAGVGVGTAMGKDGRETGVLLLGGFSDCEI